MTSADFFYVFHCEEERRGNLILCLLPQIRRLIFSYKLIKGFLDSHSSSRTAYFERGKNKRGGIASSSFAPNLP